MNMKTPDEVCKKFTNKEVELNVYKLDDSIILEGNEESLKFLGELILSQSSFEADNSFGIAPKGAGSKFFQEKSSFGIYIHRKE